MTSSSEVTNEIIGNKYKLLELLGKGGFAECYKVQDQASGSLYAAKMISKTRPGSNHEIYAEVAIHRSLYHPHIVRFHSFFHDLFNGYIIMELCEKGTLMEIIQSGNTISEPETRYLMLQILLGVRHLHRHKIVHRDLKLGNVFLDKNMHVKIGDFGLAAKVTDGQKLNRLCGTPIYMAPEMVTFQPYSFTVDVWGVGCIMYILLVGRPPFYSETPERINNLILKGDYRMPSAIGEEASTMVRMQLTVDPDKRASVDQLLENKFFKVGTLPSDSMLLHLTENKLNPAQQRWFP